MSDTNAKFSAYDFICAGVRSNALHLLWCELLASSIFQAHITHVICVSAQKQMGRINTGWHVTMMTDQQAIRDRTNKQSISQSVGFSAVSINSQSAIALMIFAARPEPASRTDLGVLPKTIYQGLRLVVVSLAFIAAVFIAVGCTWSFMKDAATALTGKWYCFSSHIRKYPFWFGQGWHAAPTVGQPIYIV